MQDNEKKPALRFKGFTDPWEQRKLVELTKTVMTVQECNTRMKAKLAMEI